MSEAAIRAEIKTILEAVTGIGVVHNRRRWTRSFPTYFSLMTSGGIVNGWQIHREATSSEWVSDVQVERSHVFSIFGVYGQDDENDSESTFQALIESIFQAFRDAHTVGGTALNSELLHVESVGEEEHAGTLYHVCELVLAVREREIVS